jgi:hypothetical protein
MSEKFKNKDGKKFLKHFSNEKERNMLEIADEEYIEMADYENENLPDEFYDEENLGFYDWDEI